MYQSNRSLNIPPGNPPGIWILGKFVFKFPPPEAEKLFKCPIIGPFQVIKCPHPRETSQLLLLCSGIDNTLTCKKIIQMVLEYLQIQSNVYASLWFSASPPRIGYRSLWMHKALSPPWFTTPRRISATCNMKSRSDQTPHPLWVVIKCPAPGKTKFIKFRPSRAGKYVKCPGYARGGEDV